MDPEVAPYHGNHAAACIATGDYEGGLTAARRAVELDPGYARGHARAAWCALHLGELEAADAGYGAALAALGAPVGAANSPSSSATLEQVLAELKRAYSVPAAAAGGGDAAPSEAERYARERLVARACAMLLDAAASARDSHTALDHLRFAVELVPGSHALHVRLIDALQSAGDLRGAYAHVVELAQTEMERVEQIEDDFESSAARRRGSTSYGGGGGGGGGGSSGSRRVSTSFAVSDPSPAVRAAGDALARVTRMVAFTAFQTCEFDAAREACEALEGGEGIAALLQHVDAVEEAWTRAATSVARGDTPAAMAAYRDAARISPHHVPSRAEAMHMNALGTLAAGDAVEALATCSGALALAGEMPDILATRAHCARLCGQHERAVADLEAAVRIVTTTGWCPAPVADDAEVRAARSRGSRWGRGSASSSGHHHHYHHASSSSSSSAAATSSSSSSSSSAAAGGGGDRESQPLSAESPSAPSHDAAVMMWADRVQAMAADAAHVLAGDLETARAELREASAYGHYRVLGVDSRAPQDVIKRRYRELAMKWHPDKNVKLKRTPSQCVEAEARFKEIVEAYAVIGDPDARRKYDVECYIDKVGPWGVVARLARMTVVTAAVAGAAFFVGRRIFRAVIAKR
jgi:tetratricopeptide (TPR) repeat protein